MIERYSYKVQFSEEEKKYVGICEEFPHLVHVDKDSKQAMSGIKMLVKHVVSNILDAGDTIPRPLKS
jgi:hypothetical protein